MIVARVNAGLARAKAAIAKDGKFETKSGNIRKRLGRGQGGRGSDRPARRRRSVALCTLGSPIREELAQGVFWGLVSSGERFESHRCSGWVPSTYHRGSGICT